MHKLVKKSLGKQLCDVLGNSSNLDLYADATARLNSGQHVT